ncbi:MAG TPA: hypothetical protein VE959_12290 [Bryobacteraceae bacterium]|nr:hypothetical protein [Bryobacteraceae bacterium]
MASDLNNRIPRRNFIKQASQVTALGFLPGGLSGASGRIALIVDPADPVASSPPVKWAAEQVRLAVTAKGASLQVSNSPEEAGDFSLRIVVAGVRSAMARAFLKGGTVPPREAFLLMPGKMSGMAAVLVSGSDASGFVYGLLELADRVRYGADPMSGLALAQPIQEQPANQVRSIARAFVSDVEDKPWFYDREFWRDYLTTLAAQRFNRFALTFGLGYDFPRGVTGDYLHFPYPYLLDVPGYRVRAVPLDDAERDRNLEMLRFISGETALRGLDFQLALWTHAYEWTDSPHSHHHIEGLTPETHAPYCRDALALLLKNCPAIRGLTFRVHGESGVPEGSYSFWRTVFDGIVRAGRRIEIDMHAKGIDSKMMDVAVETGMPVKISAKYWAEHMGLGYHQAAIRELEMPRDDEKVDGIFSLSNGSRRFLRYGYGDLFQEGRRYDVLFRIWAGTQRLLLWGDPATAAAYGHSAHFCGASGVEICEPLFFKGRQGSGLPGGRCAYADESLNPTGGDFRKYEYTYRIWGRLLYHPETDPENWRRYLRTEFGAAGTSVENALSHASRVLPLITTAHLPSASNLGCWMEVYTNMPIVEGGAQVPYGDTVQPKRLGTVSPLDPELFSTIEEHAGELLKGPRSGKYSPVEVAQWLEDSAAVAERELGTAVNRAPSRNAPEFRRVEEDVRIQVGLAQFFAAQLRSGVLFDIYRRTGDGTAREQAIAACRRARNAWASMAERAQRVYRADITFGETPVRRGHWMDRLPAIDKDLAAMEAAHLEPAHAIEVNAEVTELAIRAAMEQPRRVSVKCDHIPPERFQPGNSVSIGLRPGGPVASARLHYRRVNQAERWQVLDMERDGPAFRTAIPADYTRSPYALEYYFELRRDAATAWLHPGFAANLDNQPYFVLMAKR